jgi:hypothetical protein
MKHHPLDRISQLRYVSASSLIKNPSAWKSHPREQKYALEGSLTEIGMVLPLLARETPSGELMLLDGHLRAKLLAHQVVPVLVVDVGENEGNTILATLDPVARMSEVSPEKLGKLLHKVETGEQALAELLTTLAEGCAIIPRDDVPDHLCPSCGHQW